MKRSYTCVLCCFYFSVWFVFASIFVSLILNTLLSVAECDVTCDVTPALDGLAAVMFRKHVNYIGQNDDYFWRDLM